MNSIHVSSQTEGFTTTCLTAIASNSLDVSHGWFSEIFLQLMQSLEFSVIQSALLYITVQYTVLL